LVEIVIPAKAGIQLLPLIAISARAGMTSKSNIKNWIPACAGMTAKKQNQDEKTKRRANPSARRFHITTSLRTSH